MIVRLALAVALVLIQPTATLAQTTPVVPAGVTVVGRGVVRVRADLLRVNATLVATPGRGSPADVEAAADAIVKALHDGGVTDAFAGPAGGFAANAPRVVTGSIRKPTREMVESLFKRGEAAAAPFSDVNLQNVTFSASIDDCGPAETQAQNAALAEARAHAGRAAAAAGARLGPVLNVNEATNFGGSACATKPDIAPNLYSRVDPDQSSADVYVSVIAIVTFAIER